MIELNDKLNEVSQNIIDLWDFVKLKNFLKFKFKCFNDCLADGRKCQKSFDGNFRFLALSGGVKANPINIVIITVFTPSMGKSKLADDDFQN